MPRTESEPRAPRQTGAFRKPRPSAMFRADGDAFALEGPLVKGGEVDDGAFDPQRSYLLPRFRAFYGELSRVKRVALRDPLALLGAGAIVGADEAAPSIYTIASAASERLQNALEQLALDAASDAGETGATLFADAQYAMAALADEIFLNTEWAGRETWLDVMVERQMFGTMIAGEEIFTRIDRLLASRTGNAAELATVYFMLLSLGFEGRFRGGDGTALTAYRQRLYRFLYRRDPSASVALMVPQAYGHTIGGVLPARLPYVQRWTLIFLLTLATYLTISHLEWRSLTRDVRETTDDILNVAKRAQAQAAPPSTNAPAKK